MLLPILHEPQVRQPNSSPYPTRAASAATKFFSLSYTAVKISPPTVFRKPPIVFRKPPTVFRKPPIVFRKPPILLRGHRPDFPKAPKLHPQKAAGRLTHGVLPAVVLGECPRRRGGIFQIGLLVSISPIMTLTVGQDFIGVGYRGRLFTGATSTNNGDTSQENV